MKYSDFELHMSAPRMSRYLFACGHQQRKAMALYRANLKLSQKMFSVLGVFEVVLRNKIDEHYKAIYAPRIGSEDWLLYAASRDGFYADKHTMKSQRSIQDAVADLGANYSHNKLIAELNFGFWRFQFGPKEFRAAGSTLHRIFTSRPYGTNHTAIFNKLRHINNLRNRIAHHEPICFDMAGHSVSTNYVLMHYGTIRQLLQWMNIDAEHLFYGIDGIRKEVQFLQRL